MSKKPLSQTEIDLSLHELGQRLRAAWEKKQEAFEKNLTAFREGVREDWEQAQTMKPEKPAIEAPKIEEPEIGPPKKPDRQPDEPDIGR